MASILIIVPRFAEMGGEDTFKLVAEALKAKIKDWPKGQEMLAELEACLSAGGSA